ncbi:hypothetical protein AVEN_129012-1 [Araneus ventricosus]|uniref:Uncharacterized protein n=1 Tax=Araneus ventricosus TaxID=182803 RepID=A0A4Y2WF29_ARAVE|nr:hypothetical protein AVEN_129012-1 [Araneus ventricosus]
MAALNQWRPGINGAWINGDSGSMEHESMEPLDQWCFDQWSPESMAPLINGVLINGAGQSGPWINGARSMVPPNRWRFSGSMAAQSMAP